MEVFVIVLHSSYCVKGKNQLIFISDPQLSSELLSYGWKEITTDKVRGNYVLCRNVSRIQTACGCLGPAEQSCWGKTGTSKRAEELNLLVIHTVE